MINSELDLKMKDDQSIHLYLWQPDPGVTPAGIIQIVHGAAEHGRRYADFAGFLVANGYIVCASDHRGHGLTAKKPEDLGFFAQEDGWRKVVDDIHTITLHLKTEHPGLKTILLGHSMGSFLARTYATLYGSELSGLILSGTAHNPKPILIFGRTIAQRDVRTGHSRKINPLLNKLSFTDLNKGFKGGTLKEWISGDPATVKAYVEDKLCGFDFTSSAFRDMFEGLLYITDRRNIAKIPKDLPILILSGKEDPVGGKGKMVVKCHDEFARAGINNLQLKLYDGMRHEILNETDKKTVYGDILNWLKSRLD